MIAANRNELAIGNIVRRVLHIVREEEVSLATSIACEADAANTDNRDESNGSQQSGSTTMTPVAADKSSLRAPSLHNLLQSDSMQSLFFALESSCGVSKENNSAGDKSSKSWSLKDSVTEGINELLEDINSCRSQISEQALEHIHEIEVILTLGRSRTLLDFLLEAKKKRSFQVFIAEGAPRYHGHRLAKELAALDLQTTMITDSAIFAMVARVDMVIVGAHGVMANGGVIAPIGFHMAALAARHHAVPFVVLFGLHKLCPLYPHSPHLLVNEMKSPAQILDFGDISDCVDQGLGGPSLHAVNPNFDYIPPELVSLFITDIGGYNPSYLYRLVAEYYSPEDSVL